ncbi:hypothetical protein HPB50_001884 [Hyalomma asiaticum]|uniref:Uncharacterized protein n=1 Tax=Hyalomma asiaticum TaxID=266040 RepID=A0ACB7SSJ8_HYAAI|nr:hypothetical protein HPB50_001884 [Hyalomma asiaticum]
MSERTDENALGRRREDEGRCSAPSLPEEEQQPMKSPPHEGSRRRHHSDGLLSRGEVPIEGIQASKTHYGSHSLNFASRHRQIASSDDDRERRSFPRSSAEEAALSDSTQGAPPGFDDFPPASTQSWANDRGLLASSEPSAEAQAAPSAASSHAPQSGSERTNVSLSPRTVDEAVPFQRVDSPLVSDWARPGVAAHQLLSWTPFVESPGDNEARALHTSRAATVFVSPESAPPESATGVESEWFQTATSTAPTPVVLPPHAALQTRDGQTASSPAPDHQQPSTSSLYSTPLCPAQNPAVPAGQATTGSNLATMSSVTSPGSRPEKGYDAWNGTAVMVTPVVGAKADMSSSAAGSKTDTSTANWSEGKHGQQGKFHTASESAWTRRKLKVRCEVPIEGIQASKTHYGSHYLNVASRHRQIASSDDDRERRSFPRSSAEEAALSDSTQGAPPGFDDFPPASTQSWANDRGLLESSEPSAEAQAAPSAASSHAPQSGSEGTNVALSPRTVDEAVPFQRVDSPLVSDWARPGVAAHQLLSWTPFVESPGDNEARALHTSRAATVFVSPESAPPESATGVESEWFQTATSTAPTPVVLPPHAALQTRDGQTASSPAPDHQQPSTSSLYSTPLGPAQNPAVPAGQAATGSNLATMSSVTSPGSRPEKGYDAWNGTAVMVTPVVGAKADMSSSAAGSKTDTSTANALVKGEARIVLEGVRLVHGCVTWNRSSTTHERTSGPSVTVQRRDRGTQANSANAVPYTCERCGHASAYGGVELATRCRVASGVALLAAETTLTTRSNSGELSQLSSRRCTSRAVDLCYPARQFDALSVCSSALSSIALSRPACLAHPPTD